jgi:hypothetical protein
VIHTDHGDEEIRMELVSIYLGIPIGFNRFENTKHGQEVLASIIRDARTIGRSELRITQKMVALKRFVLPRIDHRMMCADLNKSFLDRLDSQIRALVGEWFGMRNILVELSQMSWRDGGFSFHTLLDRQNTLVIRTLLDMITSPDEPIRMLMCQFAIEEAGNCGIE